MHPTDPLVSVVIPNFNHGPYIEEAIESVLRQTLKSVEVIVVDGGSTSQATIATLRSIRNDRVTVHFREGRHFVGSNRNFGIERCRGKYICCLDADDLIDPTYLEKAYYLAEAGGIDVVSTSCWLFGSRSLAWNIPEQPTLGGLLNANAVCVSGLFKKSDWEAVGGYHDAGIGRDLVAEDWDFWVRLAARGATFWNISREHLLKHRQHEGPSLGRNGESPTWAEQGVKIKARNAPLLTPEAIERSAAVNQVHDWKPVPIDAGAFETKERTYLVAVPFFHVGGGERLTYRLCKGMKERGWNPVVVGTRPGHAGARSLSWFEELGAEFFWLSEFLPQPLWGPFLRHLIATRQPGCVINGGSRLLYELLPDIRRDFPEIVCADFLYNIVGHAKSHMEFQEHLDIVLAESNPMRRWHMGNGWREDRIHLVPVGVDLERFRPRERPAELAAAHRIVPEDVVVGYVGRMSPEKGSMQFIEMMHLLSDEPNLKFVMVGDGGQSDLIRDTAPAAVTDPDMLSYVGVVDAEQVPGYLNLCDMVVVPSRYDGRPLVVIEALASGVPVIASNVGGISDLIEDGVNGFLVAPTAVETMAARVLTLAKDRDLRRRMGDAARRGAEQVLREDAGFDSYEAVLRLSRDQLLQSGLVRQDAVNALVS
jgi:glycosyltransferase involved in cell wall biosynthesis